MSVSLLLVLLEGPFVVVAHLHVLPVAVEGLFELLHVGVFGVVEHVGRYDYYEVLVQPFDGLRLQLVLRPPISAVVLAPHAYELLLGILASLVPVILHVLDNKNDQIVEQGGADVFELLLNLQRFAEVADV